jgi:hypothetical protein
VTIKVAPGTVPEIPLRAASGATVFFRDATRLLFLIAMLPELGHDLTVAGVAAR